MKTQEKMPTTKIERSAKFVKTGFQIGGNYIKHYSKKLFNPEMNKDECQKLYEKFMNIYKNKS